MLTARRGGKDNQYDYTWTNSLQQRVELTDEKGVKFTTNGFNWIQRHADQRAGDVHFQRPVRNEDRQAGQADVLRLGDRAAPGRFRVPRPAAAVAPSQPSEPEA